MRNSTAHEKGAKRLSAIGQALYGERWQTELARALGLSDGRRIRQWLSGDRSIPPGVWGDLSQLIKDKQASLQEALILSCDATQ